MAFIDFRLVFLVVGDSQMRFLTLSIFTLLVGFLATAHAQVIFTEIDLSNNRIEIVNAGDSTVDLSGWWVCNRFNGSPFYGTLTDQATIDTQLSTAGATFAEFAAGQILVLDIADADFLPDDQGEFSLYNTNSFGSATAIETYVAWGANVGVRDTVAGNAGIWTANDFIDIAGLGANETIQLAFGEDSFESTDFAFGSPDLGSFAAPSVLLGDVDLDGAINFLDITPFIALVASGEFQAEADVDQNQSVNFLDISPFIQILSGP